MAEERGPRVQVNVRLDADLLDALDAAARAEGVDRTELARRLLDEGLARHRIATAVTEYGTGKRTAWSAAERAGVSLYELLDRIEEAGLPSVLDATVLDRLRAPRRPRPPRAGGPGGGASGPAGHDIERVRASMRPERVRILLVGESSPAGGTHFYLANSHLYRAVRAAMAMAYGPTVPPDGERFLDWFRELGFWLVDIADRPVDALAATDRRTIVRAGIPGLAALLGELDPSVVVGVKTSLEGPLREAAESAGLDDDQIVVLPFPLYQWRGTFERGLADVVRRLEGRGGRRTTVAEERAPYAADPARGLHEAIATVLARHDPSGRTAREIADEIARDDLWRRPSDARHPSAGQISARVARYRSMFERRAGRIRLVGQGTTR